MKEFLLVMKGTAKNWQSFSAEDKQRIMEKYFAFVNRLKREERFKGGSALGSGAALRSTNGLIVTDGPFAETKEALNGYFVFSAESFDQALTIARECPALSHGETVEIFELTSH